MRPSATRPVIGITQCLDDCGRWRSGRTYGYLDTAYASAVETAGGIPLLLPIAADAAPLVHRIDGLLVPGGDDFSPSEPGRYPADAHFDPAPARQIAFDLSVLAAAEARRLPVLGICYGMQLLAVRHGGSLYYHLPADAPECAPHQLTAPEGRHPIDVVRDTRLAEILGPGTHAVNSLHHQAVRAAGAGLRVCASAPDGTIEAIERADRKAGPFELGVQWHPEKLPGTAAGVLFAALVAACAERSRTG